MKKLTLPRNADWTAAWVYYSCEDVIRRDEFEGFLAYYNGYYMPDTASVQGAIVEALGASMAGSDCFDKEETQQITLEFLRMEKAIKVEQLLSHEPIVDSMWAEYCGTRIKPGDEHHPTGTKLTQHNGHVCVDRQDLTYVCAVLGADAISEDVVQEILKVVPLKDASFLTIDEAYDIYSFARATEGFQKKEKDFFKATFKKFDADGGGELDMDEYEQVLGYLGYSADDHIMEAIKSDIYFKTPECLNDQEFLKAMRVYRTMEVVKFKELFSKYDEDGSGGLSIEELDPLIREIGYIPTVVMLKELCRLSLGWAGQPTDVPDAELEVTRENFVKFMRTFQVQEGFTQKETTMLNEGFAQYSEQTGEVSVVELTGFMRWAGYACRSIEVQAICDIIDVQQDGQFDFPEVMKIFRMRRDWELAKVEKILYTSYDDDGEPIARASLAALSSLLEEIGYEASFKRMKLFAGAKDDNHLISWFELQAILDKVRKDEQVCQRERCGFAKGITDLYMRGFKTYAHENEDVFDDDAKFTLPAEDVSKLMKYIGTLPNNKMESEILDETLALEKGRNLTFIQMLRVLRQWMDEISIVVQKREREISQQCGFDADEVETFRAIYKQQSQESNGAFGIDVLHKLLVSLGIGGLNNPQSGLRKKLEEVFRTVDIDDNDILDFMEFMVCMKKLLDIDFGQIQRLTGMAASRAASRGRTSNRKRASVAEAMMETMRDPMEDPGSPKSPTGPPGVPPPQQNLIGLPPQL